MDTYENNGFPQEPADIPQEPAAPPIPEPMPEQDTYRGAGSGRKESPYADSPYVMNRPAQQYRENTWVPPVPPERPAQPKAKKRGKAWSRILAAVLTVALVAGGCVTTALVVNRQWESRMQTMQQSFNDKLAAIEEQLAAAGSSSASGSGATHVIPVGSVSQVYADNVDTVVIVYATVNSTQYGQPVTGTSTGSGFFVSADGYALTNHHVIEGETEVTVVTHGGTEYQATVIGSDSANDVALLKVEAENLPYARLGSSDDLIVGDQVVAIGNPLGELTSTATVGYVSGIGREVTTDGTTINMIQTDAAINSGNSGGPLFNMAGEVVGITTAKYSGNSSSGASIEGIGFAIPINDVQDIAQDLMEFGYVKSAYMGVVVRDMNAEAAELYNLPLGAYVDSVEEGGPAQKAGIRAEDIIIALDDQKVTGINSLTKALRGYEPGDTAAVTVLRAGQELQLTITLTEKPRDTTVQPNQQPEGEMPSDGSYEEWFDYFAPFFGGGFGGNG